jgi:anaerobic magnesium-protoporphyrin IX monomethyl ester cyclase
MKVLLINPPYVKDLYSKSKLSQATWNNPPLALAALASTIKEKHEVRILDLNVEVEPIKSLSRALEDFHPDYAGITFTTPSFNRMKEIASAVKDFDDRITIIGGGAHASSFPEETLLQTRLDIVVRGEADQVLPRIVSGEELTAIQGAVFKTAGGVQTNPPMELLRDLDLLPYPSWELYDLSRYKNSRLVSRRNPAGFIETSRGCVYNCVYCNKSIFGRTFRVKSAGRVVDEMKFMLASGFREIHVVDDGFSTDLKRAKAICDLILSEKLDVTWNLQNGLRVDRVDEKLMKKLRDAGCYRVTFGVESGNEQVLRNIRKDITLDMVRNAVRWARRYDLEVFGYFMLALPGETRQTMQDTIDLARNLDFDYAKFTIMIPLPATEIYDAWKSEGYIKNLTWDHFHFHTQAKDCYTHPTLDWDTIHHYYAKAFRSFYLRPSFIAKRAAKGIRNGDIFSDIYHFIKTRW